MICFSCGKDVPFAVYDACDQAMCMNCGAVMYEFHAIEAAIEINHREGKRIGGANGERKSDI